MHTSQATHRIAPTQKQYKTNIKRQLHRLGKKFALHKIQTTNTNVHSTAPALPPKQNKCKNKVSDKYK